MREERGYGIVEGYRRTFRFPFLQFTGSSPQFQRSYKREKKTGGVMCFEGKTVGIFLCSAAEKRGNSGKFQLTFRDKYTMIIDRKRTFVRIGG
ncbi:hypothetical protein DW876_11500 [Hungatella hathewayi]|nr:hypothetical protein DW876_11500 [Hungatella hathewayi]